MVLPIYQTDSRDLTMLQTTWAQQLNPIIGLPTNQGTLLTDVALVTGANVVNHKLGKKLQGWMIVRQRSAASIYDTQDVNTMPGLTLYLTSSANVRVDLFVF